MSRIGAASLVQQARAARLPLALMVASGLALTAVVLGQAVALATVIGDVVADGASLAEVRTPLLWFIGLAVCRAVLGWVSGLAGRAAATAVKTELRGALLHRVVEQSPARLGEERIGRITLLAGGGLDGLDSYFATYVPQIVLACLVPLVVVGVTASYDLPSALILGLTIPLIPVFMALIGMAARGATERRWQSRSELSAHLLDVLQGWSTLRLFGRAERQVEVVRAMAEENRVRTNATLRLAFVSSLVLELIATLGTALVAVAAGLRLVEGGLDLRTALLVVLLAPEAYQPLRNLGSSFHASRDGATAASDALSEIATETAPLGRKRSQFPVEVDEVTVRWANRDETVLDNVDLHVQPGERIAVVGETGVGKSTLLNVILGFVTPDAGEVGVADRDIGWLPQRPHLFSATVADNIRMGWTCPHESVVEVARSAQALAFIEGLPDGFDTVIGDGGRQLSGGEAQRLALARIFLRDSQLVLLDEPTAGLDAANQALILDALERLLADRAAIIVTHRDNPIALADRVLHLANGRLYERVLT